MAKAKKFRAYMYPLKHALPCTLCKHGDNAWGRICTKCFNRTSQFELKTERQINLMGLKVEDGRVYKEVSLEESGE